MLSLKDTIRDGSAMFGDAEKQVKLLYPVQSKIDQLLARDEQRFLNALEKCVGPFLREGDDKDKPLKEFAEPIGEVARWHRLVYIDLKTLACELNVENPQDILTKVGEKRLKQLGLEALLKVNGVISRPEWEAIDGVSLMQELARELRYTPFRPL